MTGVQTCALPIYHNGESNRQSSTSSERKGDFEGHFGDGRLVSFLRTFHFKFRCREFRKIPASTAHVGNSQTRLVSQLEGDRIARRRVPILVSDIGPLGPFHEVAPLRIESRDIADTAPLPVPVAMPHDRKFVERFNTIRAVDRITRKNVLGDRAFCYRVAQ